MNHSSSLAWCVAWSNLSHVLVVDAHWCVVWSNLSHVLLWMLIGVLSGPAFPMSCCVCPGLTVRLSGAGCSELCLQNARARDERSPSEGKRLIQRALQLQRPAAVFSCGFSLHTFCFCSFVLVYCARGHKFLSTPVSPICDCVCVRTALWVGSYNAVCAREKETSLLACASLFSWACLTCVCLALSGTSDQMETCGRPRGSRGRTPLTKEEDEDRNRGNLMGKGCLC